MAVARFQKEGNELYPLPPDYMTLGPSAQKLARVNACKLQETPEDLVHAWSFFRSYYLMDDIDLDFNPGWYKKFKVSPPCHYQMIHSVGQYPYNLIGFPRDFAKSTVYLELAMLMFLTRVNFSVALIYSRLGLVTSRFANLFMYQLTTNQRILDDFGVVKPGMQKGQWCSTALTNAQTRSTITGHAVKGSLLGARPDLILMDDCEYDDELKVSATELIEHMDRFIHNVVLPMQTKGSASIAILGTLLNQRCWIARWMNTEVADDVRVKYWNRMVYSAEDTNADGTLLWEAKFNRETLAEDKERLGPAAYSAQRLNQPGKHGSGLLRIDKHQNQYTLEDDNGQTKVAPLQSKATLVSWKGDEKDLIRLERPYGETVSRMSRVLLVDYAACNSSTSDFVNMLVLGVETSPDYKDVWWVLDNYSGRIRGAAFFNKMFTLGYKWRCKYIGIEAVASQIVLPGVAEAYAHLWEGTGWRPRIIPIIYPGGLSKEDRISCLETRFMQARVKFPWHLRNQPGVRELYMQTRMYTGSKGCLRYDDAIDTLAMAQYWLSCGASIVEQPTAQPGVCHLEEELKAGNTHNPEGLWIAGGLSASEMPMDLVRQLAEHHEPDSERNHLWHSLRRRTPQ